MPQIWIMAAQFEIRQMRLDAARKILGMALGMCPKVGGWAGAALRCGAVLLAGLEEGIAPSHGACVVSPSAGVLLWKLCMC